MPGSRVGSSKTGSSRYRRARSSVRTTATRTSIASSAQALAAWLRCPRCERDLASVGLAAWSLSCSSGHVYDANKRGYLNLVDRSRGIVGDTAEILLARDRFLAGGHYSAIADLLSEVVPREAGLSLVDSGCGTGYYLTQLLQRRNSWQALALDVSVDAVSVATRATHSPGLVADVWKPLPIRDGRADVVVCVFAPRNVPEFARVLDPGGRLVVVTPSRDHLRQLRDAGRVIGMQEDKLAHLDAGLAASFVLDRRESLSYEIQLDETEVDALASMGPSGHHVIDDGAEDAPRSERTTVTVAVDVSSYRLA